MCGFGGIISSKKTTSESGLRAIAGKVSFRGPDDTGVRIYNMDFEAQADQGQIGLFFNRLAIIDLDKRSNQPFENERYVLVFNGEIYNYRELRSDLVKENVLFETSSDTEVLFNLLIKYGTSSIGRLNGMFAFCFFDKKERRVILSRDRTGIKPVCYYNSDSTFAFGSEVDSIIRMIGQRPPVSQRSIDSFFSLQYIPTPDTIWENVFKLPPGSYIEECVDNLGGQKVLKPVAYFDPHQIATDNSGNAGACLETLLANSLKMQLQADVPLGLFLSSGIDSSVLAALINKHFSQDQQFNFYTVAFDENVKYKDDESKDAKAFLEGFRNTNFSHHILHVNPSVMGEVVSSMYNFIDEPFGDYAVMMNYVVSRKAREHVTVVLSGDGSDELFWGYTRYSQWTNLRQKSDWIKPLQPMNRLVDVMPNSRLKRKLAHRLSSDPLRQYMNMVASGHFTVDAFIKDKNYWWAQGIDALKARPDLPSLVDMKTYLPDCMFYKVDRSSMGASLEVRVPFLDNDVINYALRMGLREKSTPDFATKSPLKKMLRELAPHYKFDLPKRGFSFPLRDWLSNEWKEIVYSTTVREHLTTFGLKEEFDYILKDYYKNNRDVSVEVWRMVNLALWYEAKKNSF